MYDHQKLEQKWREIWDKELESGTSNWLFDEQKALKEGKKSYLLDMFPYPSGSGLHVGHVEEKAAIDILARYKRMKGENVLMPTGYDSFGLPTENYAIKNNLSPQEATKLNTKSFHEQVKRIGISYDWTRELAASDPEYYKFTQWWFTFLYERGLAYRKKQKVNWCPVDKTVLANEQVIDGKCERCDSPVVQKDMEQWFFKITDYAERLLNDLSKVDWPESTKAGQRNWIGRTEGIEITYRIPKYLLAINAGGTAQPEKPKVLFATTNQGKLKRFKMIFEKWALGYDLIGLEEAGIEQIDVEEGDDPIQNAIAKVKAYMGKTKMPVLADDSALYIEGFEANLNPAEVRRSAVSAEEEPKLTTDEIAEKMIAFYQGKLKEAGKIEAKATWKDALSLMTPDGKVETSFAERYAVLTNERSTEFNPNFPLNNISRPAFDKTKFIVELDDDGEMQFINNLPEKVAELVSEKVTVYTTRPDTNFGATFIVVAPDSRFVEENLGKMPRAVEAGEYVGEALRKTELERMTEGKVKTGEFTGQYAWNPLSEKFLPIFISDFVLSTVGTGAVVGVPGHDMRDFEFAKAKKLDIVRVVVANDGNNAEITESAQVQEAEGKMINSQFLDGLEIMEAKEKIKDYLEQQGWGKKVVNYKLRDWSISRQRYWGAPIPVLYKELAPEEQELNEKYQEKPQSVLDLHAWDSSPRSTYHPWLATKLKEQGVRASTPLLPSPAMPVNVDWYHAALDAFSEIGGNENSVITARSLGCVTALQLAETKKLRKLVLLCPVSKASYAKDKQEFAESKSELTKDQMEMFDKFVGETDIDFEKVRNNVAEIVVYLSTTDPYIPLEETRDYLAKGLPSARILTFRDSDHFSLEAGYEKFPALMEEILKPVRLDIQTIGLEDLPVELPMDVDYRPQGEAPLATSKEFNQTINNDKYGKNTRREVDTMDTFVCSSWYYFRFLDVHNQNQFADLEKANKITPVDFYIGGAEHTVLHLLYARFFTKVAYDAGLIDFDEPFMQLRHQGTILGPDGRKMSKRWGNVINPNEIVDEYGADTLRMYEMFMGPLDQKKAWNEGGVKGIRRFLQKVWDMNQIFVEVVKAKGMDYEVEDTEVKSKLETLLNNLIDKVESDIKALKFNTAISEMMKFVNELTEVFSDKSNPAVNMLVWLKFMQVLYPFAPFMTSEIWAEYATQNHRYQNGYLKVPVYESAWPAKIEGIKTIEEKVQFVVMINGKLRDKFSAAKDITEAEALKLALASENVQKYVETEAQIKQKIFVPGKLINIVV
jgi:leucyl-tRNA synthetase/inosine/xanthosine triphosphate pyrophosphatase family protein